MFGLGYRTARTTTSRKAARDIKRRPLAAGQSLILIKGKTCPPIPEFAVTWTLELFLEICQPRRSTRATTLNDWRARMQGDSSARRFKRATANVYLYIDSDGSDIRICETRFNCYSLSVVTYLRGGRCERWVNRS